MLDVLPRSQTVCDDSNLHSMVALRSLPHSLDGPVSVEPQGWPPPRLPTSFISRCAVNLWSRVEENGVLVPRLEEGEELWYVHLRPGLQDQLLFKMLDEAGEPCNRHDDGMPVTPGSSAITQLCFELQQMFDPLDVRLCRISKHPVGC